MLDDELELPLDELEDELELLLELEVLELELELLELELLDELDEETLRTTIPASVPLSVVVVTAMLRLVSVTVVVKGGGV